MHPCHSNEECPQPRNKDGSGCICDLRAHARKYSDWPIATLVGSNTYAQLLEAAPGLFEPFPDFDRNGTAASTLQKNTFVEVTPMPNSIAPLISEGCTPADIKRSLIAAAVYGEDCCDARLAAQFHHSSISYDFPESSLSEIFATFISFAFIIAIVILLIIKHQ